MMVQAYNRCQLDIDRQQFNKVAPNKTALGDEEYSNASAEWCYMAQSA